jgi:hypothetical protein
MYPWYEKWYANDIGRGQADSVARDEIIEVRAESLVLVLKKKKLLRWGGLLWDVQGSKRRVGAGHCCTVNIRMTGCD